MRVAAGDAVSSCGLLIASYYGLTGLTSAWAYRRGWRRSMCALGKCRFTRKERGGKYGEGGGFHRGRDFYKALADGAMR